MEISKAEVTSAAAVSANAIPQELRGAEILVKSLQAEGVKYIWGYPGGAVLHIYDAFYKQDSIQHVLVRHEQAAVHAADGYARATGDVGVALVTSGPGLTNAVTGIATAYMDSIPMVIISGQVPTHAIGEDAFQECDSVGITRPCVKHNFLVKRAEDIAATMKKAFYIATTGRPGPVLVDIPKDITAAKFAFGARFDDRVIGDPKHFAAVPRKIVHIDIDPSSISKRVKVDVPIVGDVGDVLDDLMKQLETQKERLDAPALKAWWAQIEDWR